MTLRNQSEDYSRPEDVLVHRDNPDYPATSTQRYLVTRAVDEACRIASGSGSLDVLPSDTQIIRAAEALLLQSDCPRLLVTAGDLKLQMIEDRGVRFSLERIREACTGLLEQVPEGDAYLLTPRFFLTRAQFVVGEVFAEPRVAA